MTHEWEKHDRKRRAVTAPAHVDVLMTFAFETLGDVRRREFCRPPDQLLLELVRDDRTGGLVVADPWRSWIADLVRGRSRTVSADVAVDGRAIRHLRPLRLRRDDSVDIATLRHHYARYGQFIRDRAGPVDTVITAHPFVAAWSARFLGDRCLYYARDDWAGHAFFRPWWPALERAQEEIGTGSSKICAVTRTLADRLRPAGDVTVVPNGISAEVWRERRPWPFTRIPMPGRYAIYSGSIDGRLNLELLNEIARHPAIDAVVVAGPIESPVLRQQLESRDNVVVLGSLDQATLAAVTVNASVGVVPHVRSRQTTASSPLKVYEYLAGGLPVVTTDLDSVESIGERVHPCRHLAEWHRALGDALDQGVMNESQRLDTVDALSWQRRLRPIVDAALVLENRRVQDR